MTDPTLTDTLPWLDKNFIESILRRAKLNSKLVVTDINIQSAVPKGDNYASLLVRVIVNYISDQQLENTETNTTEQSLIVKSLPLGELMQVFVKSCQIFEKESKIYEVTLPKMYNLFLDRTGVDVDHLATNFYVTERPDTIVLEDLRPLGYKMADRRQGLDLHHSIKAITTLAKFHASSMVLYAEDPTTMEFYKETLYTDENREMHQGFMEHTYKALASEVDTWPGFERFGDKLRAMAPGVIDKAIALMKNDENTMKVLNHGDFWTNNMLFHYDDGKVDDVKLIDFQMARFASPALDILYFLNTSPSQDILEDFQEQLIEKYLESLNNTLKHLNYDRVVHLDEINKELKSKAFFAVIVSCMFCIIVAEPEDAPDMSAVTEENKDTVGMDSMNKAYTGKRFRYAFERRLPKFEEHGLI